MPASHLTFAFQPAGTLAIDPQALYSDGWLTVSTAGIHPVPRLHRLADGRIAILHGHPIADGQRSDRYVVSALAEARAVEDIVRAFDGSFLILMYDPGQRRLQILNDRFAGFALFYRATPDGGLAGSTSFRLALETARAAGGGQIDPDQVLVFLWLRRLLGEKTLARDILYQRSASILESSAGGIALRTYWQPGYGGTRPQGAALVHAIADALQDSMRTHMSDERRFGLLLSGGLDSRALAAAAPASLACFTTCLTRNNEYHVAHDVADLLSARHLFIPRPLDIFDGRLDDASALGGMQVYNEAQFLGYGPQVAQLADTLFIGLGLDIFFGGLYLPKKPANILGHQALHHRLLPIPQDVADFYVGAVKYRLQSSSPLLPLEPSAAARAGNVVRQEVETILARGRALGADGYDLWEYMHVHNLSRHYSFPMMASVRTFAECRAPGLSNAAFDIALAMRAEDKLDGTPYQKAIARLNPAMMAIRNANTNLPAGWSLRQQTAAKAAFALLSRVGMTNRARSPGWQDRSWPAPRAQLAASPQLMATLKELPRSEVLAGLGLFDRAALDSIIAEHQASRHDHTVLLNLLLTLHSVLRP